MPEARSSRIRPRISRLVPLPKTTKPPPRIQIQAVEPELDCGRFPVKRTAGERVDVYATILVDGHDALGAAIRVQPPSGKAREEPLLDLGNDRFGGTFVADRPGRWSFTVVAWVDRLATWQHELRRKLAAGQEDFEGELAEGAVLLGRPELTIEEALEANVADRHGEVETPPLGVDVDRELARFGAWYELFPRSFGGFEGVAEVLPRLAELGFDVVYLPPIHPIGVTNRKGKNNALVAGPDDPGSPWAIGSALGGHDAIDPSLGTLGRLRRDDRRRPRRVDRDRDGLRDPVLARPPVADRAPRVVLPPARRHAQVRGEPAEALPGHLQRQLRVGELARALAGAPRHRALLGRSRRPRLPRRQPAHEADRVLGVADRRRAAQEPRGDLPGRGVHAAREDDDARQGRLRAELHLLHLEEHEVRAAGVRPAAARLGSVLPLECIREHARHPPRVPSARRAAGVSRAPRAGGDPVALLRHLLRLRELRERARRAGLRGVPRLGEVRGEAADAGRRRSCR